MKTRSSFQQGWVEKRRREDGDVYLLRYRVRDAASETGWRTETETLRNCPNKKAARDVLQERMREVNKENNGAGTDAPVTFREFSESLWLEYLENKKIKPSTRYSYESMLKMHVLPEFGEMQLGEITPMHVTTFLAKLKKKKLSAHYLLNIYSMLRTMFDLAFEYDFIGATPVRKKLHRPKLERKEKPVLTAEGITKVLEKIPSEWKPLFFLLAITGLRAGELLGLRWEDVDWMAKMVTVKHSLWRTQLVTPKTEKSVRTLHLPQQLYDLLVAHRQSSAFTEPTDFIFCKADGTPCDPNDLRKKILYPAMDAAEIKRTKRAYGFHLFRHSAGTIVHAETKDLKLAQELLGHARTSTTADIYVHSEGDGAKAATETVARAIGACCPLIAHQRPDENKLIQ